MKKTKVYIEIVLAIILAIGLAYGLPYLFKEGQIVLNNFFKNQTIRQEVISLNEKTHTYYELYHKGDLIASITDLDKIEDALLDIYHSEYEKKYPDTTLTFGVDYYVSEVNSSYVLENIDDKIIEYLKDKKDFGVVTNIIDFSTDEGSYASIAVLNMEDFENARKSFLSNFISDEELALLNSENKNDPLTSLGEKATGFRIQENVTSKKGVANIDEVYTNEADILEYLCFGDNKEREYYTVKEGDTLQAVGFHNGLMSSKQIMTLNKDIIKSTDQILEPGTKLNVTYFTSPITIVVTKNRLKEEEVEPESPLYVEDASLYTDVVDVIQEEEKGRQYSLYEEIWINGVLVSGEYKSSSLIESAKQAIIKVGTKPKPNVGTGSFIWPIEGPTITCGWGCYFNHHAIDMQNPYDLYGKVYAPDNGTVIHTGYDGGAGYNVIIDHNNGFVTRYMHFSGPAHVSVGQTIMKGEYFADVGSTGNSTGPHVHFEIRYNGVVQNPCDYLNCSLVPWS